MNVAPHIPVSRPFSSLAWQTQGPVLFVRYSMKVTTTTTFFSRPNLMRAVCFFLVFALFAFLPNSCFHWTHVAPSHNHTQSHLPSHSQCPPNAAPGPLPHPVLVPGACSPRLRGQRARYLRYCAQLLHSGSSRVKGRRSTAHLEKEAGTEYRPSDIQ